MTRPCVQVFLEMSGHCCVEGGTAEIFKITKRRKRHSEFYNKMRLGISRKGAGAPMLHPDPLDRSISKRDWEKAMQFWRRQLVGAVISGNLMISL